MKIAAHKLVFFSLWTHCWVNNCDHSSFASKIGKSFSSSSSFSKVMILIGLVNPSCVWAGRERGIRKKERWLCREWVNWSELWVLLLLLIIAAVTLGAKVLVVVVVIALSWTSHTFLLILHLLQSHFDALFCSLLLMCLLSFSLFPFFAGWRRKYRARGAAGGSAAYTRPSMGHFAVTATGKWSARPFTYFWALSAAAVALILLPDVLSNTHRVLSTRHLSQTTMKN